MQVMHVCDNVTSSNVYGWVLMCVQVRAWVYACACVQVRARVHVRAYVQWLKKLSQCFSNVDYMLNIIGNKLFNIP